MTKETSASNQGIDNFAGLRPKMQLTGTVRSVEMFGLVVDVGVAHDGLVHVSELNDANDENGGREFESGQEIIAWVKQVDHEANRLTLTLREPAAVDWHDLKPGQVYSGKVVRVERFGIFVDIGAERPGLVHVREITMGMLRHPDEVVTLGEEVEAQVVGVKIKKRQIDLSMRALEQQAVAEIKDETPKATAMELAIRSAMANQSEPEQSKRKKRKKKSSEIQEALLQRTLANPRDE